jgi:hypothetical protein
MDPFYLIRMKMTKTKLVETKGKDRNGMSNCPSMHKRWICCLTPSPSPQQHGSPAPRAARKWRKTRSKRAGTFISCAVGSGEKIIKEEAKNACARPHSGIRLSVIDKVDNNSMKGDDNNKRNKTDNENANGEKEMSIGGSGFSLHSPGYNCQGGIVLNIHNNNICEGVDESAGAGGMFGSWPVYPISVNHAKVEHISAEQLGIMHVDQHSGLSHEFFSYLGRGLGC